MLYRNIVQIFQELQCGLVFNWTIFFDSAVIGANSLNRLLERKTANLFPTGQNT